MSLCLVLELHFTKLSQVGHHISEMTSGQGPVVALDSPMEGPSQFPLVKYTPFSLFFGHKMSPFFAKTLFFPPENSPLFWQSTDIPYPFSVKRNSHCTHGGL
jgi:hypothetical protein